MKRSEVADYLKLAMVARTDALANRHLLMCIVMMLYAIAESRDIFDDEYEEGEK